MPASISFSNLSWATPHGKAVLSAVNLDFGAELTGIVGRNGTGKTTLLRLAAGEITPTSGSVRVSGEVGVLRQEVTASDTRTVADLFGIAPRLALLDRAERGEAGIDELARADWTLPARIETALARCGLVMDPRTPLDALSGGERTRAGLAALAFAEPDILLLDEPTNNLDEDGRHAMMELLRTWRKGALVVSHDRALLEHMDAIVELTSLGASRYGGGYESFRTAKDAQLVAARRDLADAEKAVAETRRKARQATERKARKDRVGQRSRAKGGQPKILLDAAKERSEASGGASARLRDARLDEALGAVAAVRERVEVLQPLRLDLPSAGLARNRVVLRLDGVHAGHDPDRPTIVDLTLTLTGPERLAVIGPNGSGKTTLLQSITGSLAPLAGRVEVGVPFALLDQHVRLLDPERSLRENFRRLDPHADETECRAALARFGFRADDGLRRAGDLSGGERLRAGLACTLGRSEPPALLVLDEPTNHLDLDATEALEAALASYDGALVVVSHDAAFLARLSIERTLDLGVRDTRLTRPADPCRTASSGTARPRATARSRG